MAYAGKVANKKLSVLPESVSLLGKFWMCSAPCHSHVNFIKWLYPQPRVVGVLCRLHREGTYAKTIYIYMLHYVTLYYYDYKMILKKYRIFSKHKKSARNVSCLVSLRFGLRCSRWQKLHLGPFMQVP